MNIFGCPKSVSVHLCPLVWNPMIPLAESWMTFLDALRLRSGTKTLLYPQFCCFSLHLAPPLLLASFFL
jgi:hypothetical protein